MISFAPTSSTQTSDNTLTAVINLSRQNHNLGRSVGGDQFTTTGALGTANGGYKRRKRRKSMKRKQIRKRRKRRKSIRKRRKSIRKRRKSIRKRRKSRMKRKRRSTKKRR